MEDIGLTDLFVFRPEVAEAFGRPIGPKNGFLVLKGSTSLIRGAANVKRELLERDTLVRDGVLEVSSNPELFVFTRDYEFTSPSKAAGIIKNGNCSGREKWLRVSDGKSLKQVAD